MVPSADRSSPICRRFRKRPARPRRGQFRRSRALVKLPPRGVRGDLQLRECSAVRADRARRDSLAHRTRVQTRRASRSRRDRLAAGIGRDPDAEGSRLVDGSTAMSSLIEDYALIGNLCTAALVDRTGSIDWLCLPRFDSGACFAALLGDEKNGRWRLAPQGGIKQVRRRYRGETLLLETEFETESGIATVVDFMPIAERPERVD